MSRHDDGVTLRQMLDHIEEAIALSEKQCRQDLDSDRLVFLGLLKLVEIVGEAAVRVSGLMQKAHPEIPWREIVGTRNRLVHGYDSVDCDILWNIVKNDFPSLARSIRKLLLQL